MAKNIKSLYCFSSIPQPGATIYFYDFQKKKDDGLKYSLKEVMDLPRVLDMGNYWYHRTVGLLNIIVPYKQNKNTYNSYQYLFNSLFSNLKFNKIINEKNNIVKSDKFNTDRKGSIQEVEAIINKYIGDIVSSKEIISFSFYFYQR